MLIKFETSYALTVESVMSVLAARFKTLGLLADRLSDSQFQLQLAGCRTVRVLVDSTQVRMTCNEKSNWAEYLLSTAGRALLAAYGGKLWKLNYDR